MHQKRAGAASERIVPSSLAFFKPRPCHHRDTQSTPRSYQAPAWAAVRSSVRQALYLAAASSSSEPNHFCTLSSPSAMKASQSGVPKSGMADRVLTAATGGCDRRAGLDWGRGGGCTHCGEVRPTDGDLGRRRVGPDSDRGPANSSLLGPSRGHGEAHLCGSLASRAPAWSASPRWPCPSVCSRSQLMRRGQAPRTRAACEAGCTDVVGTSGTSMLHHAARAICCGRADTLTATHVVVLRQVKANIRLNPLIIRVALVPQCVLDALPNARVRRKGRWLRWELQMGQDNSLRGADSNADGRKHHVEIAARHGGQMSCRLPSLFTV